VARFSAGGLTTAGSTTLPIAALVGATTVRPHIYEIGIFNTTATAVALKLVRMTTAGTPGATLTSADVSDPESSAVSLALLKNTYSVTATMTDAGFRCQLGAAIGSGFVFTFGSEGLIVPSVANAAVGIVVENGTGQACQVYYAWWE
jgi:hypothetical protein